MDSPEPAPSAPARRALVIAPDLFFLARIRATAATLGVAVEEAALERAVERCVRSRPDLVILDLHAPGDPIALARALKSDPATRAVPIVGFYSHVEAATRTAALAAGVDHVMPRSAFTVRLPDLLRGAFRS